MTVTAAPARSATAPAALAGLRAVVRHGLRGKLRTLLAWGGSLGALAAFEVAIYPSVRDSIDKVVQSYPAGLKEAFGVALTEIGRIVEGEGLTAIGSDGAKSPLEATGWDHFR